MPEFSTPPTADLIAANLADVRARIVAACDRVGRDPATVRLVAVTKSVPAAAIETLRALGVGDVAENRPEQLQSRRAEVGRTACGVAKVATTAWHLIGHWQRKKVRRTIGDVDFFHALDGISLAETLSSERIHPAGGQTGTPRSPLPVLVQVNVSGEGTKGGFAPDNLRDALTACEALKGIRVAGLMTMAPWSEDRESSRAVFRRLRELRDWARSSRYLSGSELSMGMSDDFETGIEEGSTMVRVGRRLFAPRSD